MADVAGVTMDEVLRVAELANLDLTAEEVPRMQHDLNAILGHIAQLNELDTAGVPAMAARAECVMLNKGPYLFEAIDQLKALLKRMDANQHKKSPRLRQLRSW